MNLIYKNLLSFFVIVTFVSYGMYKDDTILAFKQEDIPNKVTSIENIVKEEILPEVVIIKNEPIASEPVKKDSVPTVVTPKVVTKPKPPTPTPTPTPVPTPAPVKQNTGKYKNGTYNGSVVDAYYGYVQVQIVVSDGLIADVNILESPSERSKSIGINNRAMPILIQETIAAQSANIDGVSGASYSSPAYAESLSYAIDQAKA